jgi:hypothetical protein
MFSGAVNVVNRALFSRPAIPPTARLEVSYAWIQPHWAPAVQDSRLPLRLLLIVLKTLNVRLRMNPLAVISIPNCSNILCEELIQIVRHLKDTDFKRGHRACFLDHDIMLLSLSVVQTWLEPRRRTAQLHVSVISPSKR